MAPEVFFSVCYGDRNPPKPIKDIHTFTPAILEGYCRHRVQYADYPGITAESGHSVRGIYATGLTDANMHKLDYFEGSDYERVNTKVKLLKQEGGKEVEGEEKDVITYVFLIPAALERREWDYEEFRKEKLNRWARGDWQQEQGKKLLFLGFLIVAIPETRLTSYQL
jgi:hypothetical protein